MVKKRPEAGERLQKVMANQGLGSRREIERWIEGKRVKVNYKVAKLGTRVVAADIIELDGRKVLVKEQAHRVIMYNKAEGEICSKSDPQQRGTVFENLPTLAGQRWISVGRLDVNTTGLLIFTTDGELANGLMHPSNNIDREYTVRVFGDVTDAKIEKLRKGVELEDGPANFSDVVENEYDGGLNRWYTVCLMEGRNREVRRLWESQDLQVNRLKRVRYGPVFLPSYLGRGQWLDLPMTETKQLYKICSLLMPELNLRQPKERIKSHRQEEKVRASKGLPNSISKASKKTE